MDLFFDLPKLQRSSKNKDNRIKAVLNDLIPQISDVLDTWTGSGDSADVTAKTIANVREVEVFASVYRNPPKTLRELELSFRSCGVEADSHIPKSSADLRSFTFTAGEGRSFQDTVEDL